MKCDILQPAKAKKLVFPQYLIRFLYRLTAFLVVLYFYLFRRSSLDLTRSWRSIGLFSPAHLLCLSMVVIMVLQHLRGPEMSMGRMKQYPQFCHIDPNYNRERQIEVRKQQNRGALKVLILWLAGNGVVAFLYFRHIIGVAEVVLLSAFYYLSDMICILFFCPFQLFFMKCKCCVNCRIFAWGSWMMATPLVLIPSPFALAPVLLSLSLLIRWEIHFRRHPEQFWEGANLDIRCANCTEHLCRLKPVAPPKKRDW